MNAIEQIRTMSSREVAEDKMREMFGVEFGNEIVDCFRKQKATNYQTYIILDKGSMLYKIGKAKDPECRFKAIKGMCPRAELIEVCNRNIESELHQEFRNKKIHGEWFSLDEFDVRRIIDKFNKI